MKILKKLFFILIGVLLISDILFSFYQHYHMPLYGDMSDIIMPHQGKGSYEVLHDPFGFQVLFENKVYSNPNRFFAHWFTSEYFLTIPIYFQNIVSPIDSIYLASAFLKTVLQVLLMYVLSVFISNSKNVFNKEFLLSALLITPLFQTSGYARYFGIIDPSVIYTIFYALPLCLLLVYYWPFFSRLHYNNKKQYNVWQVLVIICLMIILVFNGPLIPGVVLVVSLLWFLNTFLCSYKLQQHHGLSWHGISSALKIKVNFTFVFFTLFSILSLYSLFIGRNNSFGLAESISIADRYMKIPMGIFYLVSQKPGYFILLCIIGINIFLIRKYYLNTEGNKLLRFFSWIGLFVFLYILLLPLGGFRSYRENIIRYDSIMPVTISLLYIFGASALHIIKQAKRKFLWVYAMLIVTYIFIFTNADRPIIAEHFCEKEALQTLSHANSNQIEIDCQCAVMDWNKIYDFSNSELNSNLFYHWNITSTKTQYRHKKE